MAYISWGVPLTPMELDYEFPILEQNSHCNHEPVISPPLGNSGGMLMESFDDLTKSYLNICGSDFWQWSLGSYYQESVFLTIFDSYFFPYKM